jgi:UDP-GlcNAc:undecaprenyl-phosphate GlcNAc-1-phosphate transferase
VAAISAFFFGIIAWMGAQVELAILSFAFCGACLGFLKHNFPKASIFMGDSGSLFIGFTLSGIAILGSWKTINITLTLMVPILILAYPIFDTTLVTIMRTMERRSIFNGGKDHSSHRLALLGLKKKRTVLVIYSIGIICGIAAIFLTRLSFQKGAILVVLLILAMAALGIRLAMVDTTRFGRKKKKSHEKR